MPNQNPLDILIIEDNPGDSLLLTEYLELSDIIIGTISVVTALSEGMEHLSKKDADIVLLDLTLPDSTGLDTFNRLYSMYPVVPVIILTGLADTSLALDAINSGAQDFLVKGDFDEKLLSKTILYSLERQRIAESLRISNERYNLVAKATNDMVWDWDLQHNLVFRNREGWLKVFGTSEGFEKEDSESWMERVHPEDRERVAERINRIINDPSIDHFEITCRMKAAEGFIYVIDRGFAIRNNAGKAVRLIGATQNINEQKLAEAELQKLSLIVRETRNIVILTDAEGNITWVNKAFEDITGYTMEEVLGKNPRIFQGQGTSPVVKRYMRQKLKAVQPFECDVLNYTKQGKEYWIRMQCQPQFDDIGRLKGFFAVQTDITQQKEVEQNLVNSEEKYRNLFNNNPSSIFIWDPRNLKILEVNEATVKEYGYSREELLNMTMKDLIPEHSAGKELEALAGVILQEENFRTNAISQHITKDGKEKYMDITLQAIDYYGQPASLAIITNITEQIELEMELSAERDKKQQEITAAVITAQEQEREQLGKELHDNINQILATTRLYIEYSLSNDGMREQLMNSAKDFIMSAVEEIRKLSKTLLPPSLGEVGLLVAVEELIENVKRISAFEIHTELDILDESVLSEELKLTVFRIIQEQINNVIKHAEAENVWIKIKKHNNRLLISVKDDGKGFNMTDRFNGVGLKNISSRAGLHHGTMQMNTAAGKGCELKVGFSL